MAAGKSKYGPVCVGATG